MIWTIYPVKSDLTILSDGDKTEVMHQMLAWDTDQLTLPWVARLHSVFYLTFSGKAAKEEGLGGFVHIVQELCIWLSSYLHPMLQQVP